MSDRKKKKVQPAAGPAADTADAGPMSVGFLQQIVSLMAANDLSVLELREGRKQIKLQRGPAGATAQYVMSPPAMPATGSAGAPGGATAAAGQGSGGGGGATTPDADAGLIAIKSPMVGTFYTAASPDAKPFVSVGSPVDEDTDVCIIEAMKVFNNIKAECRGTIAKVMVNNGQTVEFGTVLFLVKPA